MKRLNCKKSFGGVNKPLIAAIIGIIVVVAVAVVAFIIYRSTPCAEENRLAKFFPEDVMFYGEINLSKDKLDQLQEVSNNSLTIENLKKSIQVSANTPKDSTEAIQILDEVNKTLEPKFAVGLWRSLEKESNSEDFVLVAVIKDVSNIPLLVNKLTQNEVKFSPESYNGCTIQVSTTKDKDVVYTTIDNILLVSEKAETIKKSIDNYKGNKNNILASPKNEKILNNLPKERLLTILFNADAMLNTAEDSKISSINPIVSKKLLQMKKIAKSMSTTGVGVEFKDEVLQAKSYTPYDLSVLDSLDLREKISKIINNDKQVEASKILPADTAMFFSITGINSVVNIVNQFSNEREQSMYKQQSVMFKKLTGLDLENDVFRLLSNELSVAFVMNANQSEPVILITNKPETSKVLSKLAVFMSKTDPTAKITEETTDDTKFTIISSRSMPFKVGFGQIDKLVALGKLDTINNLAAIAKKPSESVAQTATYKQLSSYLSQKPFILAYFNVLKLYESAKNSDKNPKDIQNFETLSKAIDVCIVSITSENNNAIVGKLLLKFNKK